ncbi:MAG: hypothetical protein ACOVRM_17280 [Planctomycetaceae bacterium]
MADAPGYLIGPKLLAQIQSTVRHYAQMYGGGEAGRTRQQGQERRWAILDADLLAAVTKSEENEKYIGGSFTATVSDADYDGVRKMFENVGVTEFSKFIGE